MDIIIRNGKIQHDESKRIHEIKNEAGFFKKDYNTEYLNGNPGPYYDLFNNHLHVPRKPRMIPNFCGPQIANKIKVDDNTYNKNSLFCAICHCYVKQITAFPSKRKNFIVDDDFYIRKKENLNNQDNTLDNTLDNAFKKMKIDKTLDEELISLSITRTKHPKKYWISLYDKMCRYQFSRIIANLKTKSYIQRKVINKFYQFVYKLTSAPIYYPISITETKLIWPWDLTNYQKFKLKYPEYKNLCIFPNIKRLEYFSTNYVIIE